jgi:hypothetical protein
LRFVSNRRRGAPSGRFTHNRENWRSAHWARRLLLTNINIWGDGRQLAQYQLSKFTGPWAQRRRRSARTADGTACLPLAEFTLIQMKNPELITRNFQ